MAIFDICCVKWGTPCIASRVAYSRCLSLAWVSLVAVNSTFLLISIWSLLIWEWRNPRSKRSIANAQFFTRLGRRIIKALDQQTFDGFCYRVDNRDLCVLLASGPLVMSYALWKILQEQGARLGTLHAMVKSARNGQWNVQSIKSCTRCYVRLSSVFISISVQFNLLRRMKSMISSEVLRRRGLSNNIKLGSGGIREVEFIAQVFQRWFVVAGGPFIIPVDEGF